MEGELLPAAAVAVAALLGRARLRHLGDGPAAPNKDGGMRTRGRSLRGGVCKVPVLGPGLLCSLKKLEPRDTSKSLNPMNLGNLEKVSTPTSASSLKLPEGVGGGGGGVGSKTGTEPG